MKAEGYVQIVPKRNPRGGVTRLHLEGITKGYPHKPVPGAIVAKLAVDVDPAIFEIPEIQLSLEADESHVVPMLTAVPAEQEDEEEEDVDGEP